MVFMSVLKEKGSPAYDIYGYVCWGRQGKGFFIQHGSLFGGAWLCVMGMYVIMGRIFNNRVFGSGWFFYVTMRV